ncbi:MAG: hypothetical protein NZT61_06760 [Deltaproteobacteria bacterium]|nr:hypothetical protein [Deltaproteobacteria bacterium]
MSLFEDPCVLGTNREQELYTLLIKNLEKTSLSIVKGKIKPKKISKDTISIETKYRIRQLEANLISPILLRLLDAFFFGHQYTEGSLGNNERTHLNQEDFWRFALSVSDQKLDRLKHDLISFVESLSPAEVFNYLETIQGQILDIVDHLAGLYQQSEDFYFLPFDRSILAKRALIVLLCRTQIPKIKDHFEWKTFVLNLYALDLLPLAGRSKGPVFKKSICEDVKLVVKPDLCLIAQHDLLGCEHATEFEVKHLGFSGHQVVLVEEHKLLRFSLDKGELGKSEFVSRLKRDSSFGDYLYRSFLQMLKMEFLFGDFAYCVIYGPSKARLLSPKVTKAEPVSVAGNKISNVLANFEKDLYERQDLACLNEVAECLNGAEIDTEGLNIYPHPVLFKLGSFQGILLYSPYRQGLLKYSWRSVDFYKGLIVASRNKLALDVILLVTRNKGDEYSLYTYCPL